MATGKVPNHSKYPYPENLLLTRLCPAPEYVDAYLQKSAAEKKDILIGVLWAIENAIERPMREAIRYYYRDHLQPIPASEKMNCTVREFRAHLQRGERRLQPRNVQLLREIYEKGATAVLKDPKYKDAIQKLKVTDIDAIPFSDKAKEAFVSNEIHSVNTLTASESYEYIYYLISTKKLGLNRAEFLAVIAILKANGYCTRYLVPQLRSFTS